MRTHNFDLHEGRDLGRAISETKMLVLFETACGYAIFKLLNEKKLQKTDELYLDFQNHESASQIVKLQKFRKFEDVDDATASSKGLISGKMSPSLKKLLKKLLKGETNEALAVADAKLGSLIKEKFNVQCIADSSTTELLRCIRSQIESLVGDEQHVNMTRALSHSLSRHKLKFSPDKIDIMIVQAIGSLDDMDKEINNYHMRVSEWYCWHFPELQRIVGDHETFVRTVLRLGDKRNASTCDFSDILSEEVEMEIKQAAEISMGNEVSEMDISTIKELCEEIVRLVSCRSQVYTYLKNRMASLAPNVTALVGELVGARLIAHAGSLRNLAKHPASTVQILGAEKALFRALKSKHDTPKYGLIYHASLVGQTSTKNKGKLSRMLAAKVALAVRVDALSDHPDGELGIDLKAKLVKRMMQLENKNAHRISGRGKETARPDKYENKSLILEYNPAADSTLPSVPKKRKFEEENEGENNEDAKPAKKKKKSDDADGSLAEEPSESGKKKEKKKKRKHQEAEEETQNDTTVDGLSDSSSGKKKEKKSKNKSMDED